MRHLSTLALLAALTCEINGQGLTNVAITPANPTSCTTLTFNFIGTMPHQANFTGFTPDFDSDSLNIALFAQGGGNNSPFNQELPGIGPFAAGTYTVYVTFTLNGNLVDTHTQTLTIVPGTDPYAGEYAEHLGLCTGGPSTPLIDFLGGDPDTYGTWIDANNQPVPNGLFVPGQSPEGFYTYQFNVQPPCTSTAQQILITYASPAANAGLNNSVTTCNGQGPQIDLFGQLLGTPDVGGTWSFNGQPHSNVFDPMIDDCGIYSYSVPGIGACPPAVALIDVDCTNPPNAGNVSAANDTIYRCYNDTIELMQTLVTGEQNTGIWISPAGFQVGMYNDSINLALNGPGAYGYVVLGGACPNDTSFIQVILLGDTIVGCTIGMEDVEGHVNRFDLMPNPAQDQVTIEVELERMDRDLWLEILDVDGKLVRRQRLGSNGLLVRQTINVGDLAKGAYLVRVGSASGQAVRRLMVR